MVSNKSLERGKMKSSKRFDEVKKNIKYVIFGLKDLYVKSRINSPKIESIEDTINKIIEEKVSVSRYGDGEFKWMYNLPQKSFQTNSEKLSERLREIIKSSEENHIVCLYDTFGDLKIYSWGCRRWWTIFMGKYRKKWVDLLDTNKIYYNTNISRPYMDYKDKDKSEERFNKLKKIWENRDVVIVEGEKSRLGVGNDLFDGSKSIKRILAPSTNAFDKYNEILDSILKESKEKLILLALGPTATVLAYDLSKFGYQAIDIGHVDIEYEWFLMQATSKVPIKNKFTNEATDMGGREVQSIEDKKYIEQIQCLIK